MLIALLLACHGAPSNQAGHSSGVPASPALPSSVEVVRARVCADASVRDKEGPWERVEFGNDWTFFPDYRTGAWILGRGARGVILADLNGDQHLDLVAPQASEPTRLLWGDGLGGLSAGPLPDVPELTGPTGGAAADFDGDGDLDVFLYSQEAVASVLLINDGSGSFTARVHPEWDGDYPGCGGSASWGDVDLDGDLDLYFGRKDTREVEGSEPTATGGQPWCGSVMVRNEDGVALSDISEVIPEVVNRQRILASGFYNFDEDLEPELYVIADAESGSNLLLNWTGSTFEVVEGTGLNVSLAGMGIASGDVNGDGIIDLMIPGIDELKVMMSVVPGIWSDASRSTAITPSTAQHSGWAGEWEDLDYDGVLDLAVNYGDFSLPLNAEPDEVYRGNGDETFTPMGAEWGVADVMPSRGMAIGDLNEDGWPDLVKRELGGIVVIYLSRCGTAHYVQVSLTQPGLNPDAIGAVVRVHAGATSMVRYVQAGSTSFQSGGPPVVTFGLGLVDAVDDIEVSWPGGEVTHSGPVGVDRWLRIYQ